MSIFRERLKMVYLKSNIQVDPLNNNWYITMPMLAPVQYAMLLLNHQIKIMNSYIANPELHYKASQTRKLIGGPIMNYKENRVGDIKKLLDSIVTKQAKVIDFAQSVIELDNMLKNSSNGMSLESFYERVPELLRGYIELVYDLNNNSSIRFLEGFLYNSFLYSDNTQSVALKPIYSDDRPFVLSTPVIGETDRVILKEDFLSERFDLLFSMREIPRPYTEVRNAFKLTSNEELVFKDFFTEEKPFFAKKNKFKSEGVRIRYFGHASLLIENKEVSILVDPLLSYKYETDISRYTYDDLPDSIDYVLITHAHLDHLVLESLLQLRYKIKNIVIPRSGGGSILEPSVKMLLTKIGFKNIVELDILDSLDINANCKIIGMPFLGEHHDLNISSKMTYIIQILGKTIYIAVDSNNLEERIFQKIKETVSNVDLIFIGMECSGAPLTWFYGHLLTSKIDRGVNLSRRGSSSNGNRAYQVIKSLDCKIAYVYAMGLEPWNKYILGLDLDEDSIQIKEVKKLVETCKKEDIYVEKLYGKKEIFL